MLFPHLAEFKVSGRGRGHQSHRVTLCAPGALKCPPTGVPGLRGMARRIQCDRSYPLGPRVGHLLAVPRQPRSNVAVARPGATIGALGQGVPSVSRVAHDCSIGSSGTTSPGKQAWRIEARLGTALSGAVQGPSLGGGEV
jgi:hypothetical protein